MSNILFSPLDIALSPIVAANSIYRNLNDVGDSVGVRVAYTVPGFAWNTGLTIGAGAIRMLTGLIETRDLVYFALLTAFGLAVTS